MLGTKAAYGECPSCAQNFISLNLENSILKFIMKYFLFFLFFLTSNSFSQITPSDMEEEFRNHAYCRKVFNDFDYQKIKDKNQESVFIYKSDYQKLDGKFDFLIKSSEEKFGKEDTSKMMILGIVEAGFIEWKKNISKKDIEEKVGVCRKWLFR